MIGRHLHEGIREHGERLALIRGAAETRYVDLERLATTLTCRWAALRRQRVGLRVTHPVRYVAAVAALDRLAAHAFLLGARTDEEARTLQGIFKWTRVLTEEDVAETEGETETRSDEPVVGEGTVTILTSGTTGIPKASNHTWRTLGSPARIDRQFLDTRWFAPYPLNLYTGSQVFLQAFLNWATLVLPTSMDPADVVRVLRRNRVDYATGTPTFWRQLLFFAPRDELERCELRQITMGGEAVSQDLLDQLRAVLPKTRIVHIYGSTELGRLFSIADGRAGFPTALLEEPPEEGIELRVVDGELHARSLYSMLGYDGQMPLRDRDEGWLATGDLVEIQGDRVLFRGRTSDMINVGGAKVFPSEVESVLRSVPGVADVRAYGKSSSIVGEIVAADVVLTREAEESTMRTELLRIARERLPSHAVPRILNIVPQIDRSDALKVIRRQRTQ